MEKACDGGCLPAIKTSFEYMKYTANFDRNFQMVILLGSGVPVNGEKYYFDADGKPYDLKAIQALKEKKYAIGECARDMRPYCDIYSIGCCNTGSCMFQTFKAAGRTVPAFSLKNKHLGKLLVETVNLYFTRRNLVRSGQWVDCPNIAEDRIFEIPELTEEDKQKDYILWQLPPMEGEYKRKALMDIKLA